MKLIIGILIGISLSTVAAIASDADYWRGRQTSEEYEMYRPNANESSVYSNRPPTFKNITPSLKNPC